MKSTIKKLVATFFAVVLVAVPAQAQMANYSSTADAHAQMTSDNIVQVASKAGSFGTLLAAAKAAGLVGALEGEGPLTVFAPTDDAFANLPAGTVESLLKPENKEQLKSILLYHVVEGKVTSDQVVKLSSAETLQGQKAKISVKDGKVYVDGAQVIKADVEASNGVIHVIDSVILPSD
jgi:transforming growth factor-beta-induced protein